MTSSSSSGSVPLVETLAGRAESSSFIRVGAVLFVVALTSAAAQISVPLPFTQVPFTFQPMVVLLGGLALGPRLGLASQVLYLLAGIAGLPVFAASATLPPGALRLLGPTGGYLMSYPVAALVTGYLAERGFDRRYFTSVLAMLAGLLIVYACGAIWLGVFARTGSAPMGIQAALAAGVYPFIAADLVKLVVAAVILPGFWVLLGHSHR
jgi:biotin transport system substrate-specific component